MGVLLVLGLTGTIFNLFYFTPWLSKKLQTAVKEQSQGLYTLHVGTLRASLFTGSLTLNELKIVPDFTLWEKQQTTNKAQAPALLVRLDAQQLHLAGLSFIDLLRKRPIKLNEIIAAKPVLHITQMKEDSGVNEPLHTRLQGLLLNLQVKKIQADSGTITFNSNYRNKQNILELQGVNLKVDDLQLNRSAYKDRQRVVYAQKITLNAANANLLLPDGAYQLKTGKITVNTPTQEIKMRNAALVPLLQPKELARRKGKAVTWFEVKAPDIQMAKVDFSDFYQLSNVVISTIQVRNPALQAYQNRKNFEKKGEKPLPHDLIHNLKTG